MSIFSKAKYHARRLLAGRFSDMENLASRYRLDKSSGAKIHSYIPVYESLFRQRRQDISRFLEIGIGVVEAGQMEHVTQYGYKTGGSLKFWRDYFYNARILGLDIYPVEILEKRIETRVIDQSDARQLNEFKESCENMFDVIVDDGSHEYSHQLSTFECFHELLEPDGVYIIEDISIVHLNDLLVDIRNVCQSKSLTLKVEFYKGNLGRNDNLIIAVPCGYSRH